MALSGRQPSSRCRVTPCGRPSSATASADAAQLRQLVADRLLQPARGLAGRGGQGDREALASRHRLVGQQRQHPRHRGGLAGARAAGDDRGPPAHRRLGRRDLLVAGVVVGAPAPHCRDGRRQPGLVDRGRRLLRPGRPGRRVPASPAGGSGRGRADPRRRSSPTAARPARPGRTGVRRPPTPPRPARAAPGPPRARRRATGTPTRGVRRAPRPRRPAARARRSSPPRAPTRRGDVEVGRRQQQAVVEGTQQAAAPARQPPVVLAGRLEQLGHAVTCPARRSERSSTSGTGARQVKTPHGVPPTSGVAGPHMPRT